MPNRFWRTLPIENSFTCLQIHRVNFIDLPLLSIMLPKTSCLLAELQYPEDFRNSRRQDIRGFWSWEDLH